MKKKDDSSLTLLWKKKKLFVLNSFMKKKLFVLNFFMKKRWFALNFFMKKKKIFPELSYWKKNLMKFSF